MGVEPKIGGKPPKWMVKIMENPIKMDDLGGPPLFLETPISNPPDSNVWLQECDFSADSAGIPIRSFGEKNRFTNNTA